jgi:hypothetical protein
MSLQSATEFTNVLIADPNLMTEVEHTTKGKNEAEAYSAVSALGKSRGYDFTPEEAATMREAFIRQLSDADLDGVAGGVNIPPAAINTVTTGIANKILPGAGVVVGAPLGAGINSILHGGSPSDAINAIGNAGKQEFEQVKSVAEKVFSGW